jgi:hypothetical protein
LKTLLLATAALGLLSVPAYAAPDMTKFDAACPKAGDFLLGQGPAGSDNAKVLTVLCPCLSTGFSAYPQRDVDALTNDLATGDSKQSEASYPGYAELKTRAGGILMSCLNDPTVVDALRASGRN